MDSFEPDAFEIDSIGTGARNSNERFGILQVCDKPDRTQTVLSTSLCTKSTEAKSTIGH